MSIGVLVRTMQRPDSRSFPRPHRGLGSPVALRSFPLTHMLCTRTQIVILHTMRCYELRLPCQKQHTLQPSAKYLDLQSMNQITLNNLAVVSTTLSNNECSFARMTPAQFTAELTVEWCCQVKPSPNSRIELHNRSC